MGLISLTIGLNFRIVDWINYDFEEIIHHIWKEPGNESVRYSKVRVSIHLNEPDSEVLINQKVVA